MLMKLNLSAGFKSEAVRMNDAAILGIVLRESPIDVPLEADILCVEGCVT